MAIPISKGKGIAALLGGGAGASAATDRGQALLNAGVEFGAGALGPPTNALADAFSAGIEAIAQGVPA